MCVPGGFGRLARTGTGVVLRHPRTRSVKAILVEWLELEQVWVVVSWGTAMLGLPWWDGWSYSGCGPGGPGWHCVLVVLEEWLELGYVLLVLPWWDS